MNDIHVTINVDSRNLRQWDICYIKTGFYVSIDIFLNTKKTGFNNCSSNIETYITLSLTSHFYFNQSDLYICVQHIDSQVSISPNTPPLFKMKRYCLTICLYKNPFDQSYTLCTPILFFKPNFFPVKIKKMDAKVCNINIL